MAAHGLDDFRNGRAVADRRLRQLQPTLERVSVTITEGREQYAAGEVDLDISPERQRVVVDRDHPVPAQRQRTVTDGVVVGGGDPPTREENVSSHRRSIAEIRCRRSRPAQRSSSSQSSPRSSPITRAASRARATRRSSARSSADSERISMGRR